MVTILCYTYMEQTFYSVCLICSGMLVPCGCSWLISYSIVNYVVFVAQEVNRWPPMQPGPSSNLVPAMPVCFQNPAHRVQSAMCAR